MDQEAQLNTVDVKERLPMWRLGVILFALPAMGVGIVLLVMIMILHMMGAHSSKGDDLSKARIRTIVFEQCEYCIFEKDGTFSVSHKGNCVFCARRKVETKGTDR